MVKIIGKGILEHFSREISIASPIRADNLPNLIELPRDLANNLIIVRGHHKLDFDEMIHSDDEIYLFMASMGG